MIKYMNDGEVSILRNGFFRTLAKKKLDMRDKEEFMNKTTDLNNAIKIFRLIQSLNFTNVYPKSADIMLSYLNTNNIIDNKLYEEALKVFYDDSNIDEVNDEDSLEYSDYYDFVYEREELTKNLITKLCKNKNITLYVECYEDIFLGELKGVEVYDGIFTSLRNAAGCYMDRDEEEEELGSEDYYSLFQDNCTSFALEGYVMNDFDLIALNNCFKTDECGIASEAYVENGNTYINISNAQFYDGIGYTFIAMLTIILM